jgi:hypothetical protein
LLGKRKRRNFLHYDLKLIEPSFGSSLTDLVIELDCLRVLKGLKEKIEKIDKLTNYEFLRKEILLPTISHSLERKYITDVEAKILKKVAEKQVIQAADVKEFFIGKSDAELSRQIRKLIDKKMLIPEKEGTRKYVIRFYNSYLLRGVIKALGEKGFLPIRDEVGEY